MGNDLAVGHVIKVGVKTHMLKKFTVKSHKGHFILLPLTDFHWFTYKVNTFIFHSPRQKSKAERSRHVGEVCSSISKVTADRKETTVNDTVSDEGWETPDRADPSNSTTGWDPPMDAGGRGEECLENVAVRLLMARTGVFGSSEGSVSSCYLRDR